MKINKNIILCLLPLALASCISNNQSVDFYLDISTAKIGDIQYSFSKPTQIQNYSTKAYYVSFQLTLTSKNPKQIDYKIENCMFIREKDGAEYSNFTFSGYLPLTLSCDIPHPISFSAYLPSMITEDDYYLTFKGNGQIYHYYLYDNMVDYLYLN